MARGSEKKKNSIREWLAGRNTEMVIQQPRVATVLLSLLFDEDRLLQWRTIEALGLWAKREYSENPEKVREIIRRLFWAMNDESGGFIWMAPQATGYILKCVPKLIDEYGLMLISKLREKPFVNGVLWSAWLLSKIEPKIIHKWQVELSAFSQSDIPEERVYAIAALKNAGLLKKNGIAADIPLIAGNLEEYDFETGKLSTVSIKDFLTNH